MRVCLIHIAAFICISLQGSGQALRQKASTPYLGIGAYSVNHTDVFSPLANTASLAALTQPAAGVHVENRFLLEELNTYSAIACFPTSKGNFAVTADYSGFEDFNESQLGVAYARSLGPSLSAGVKFNYYAFRIPRIAQSSTATMEFGLMVVLTEAVRAGFHVYNPVGGKLSPGVDEKLSGVYSFGIGYQASKDFYVTTQVKKEEGLAVDVLAAMQYDFAGAFFARAGVATQNRMFFGGAGWRTRRIRIAALASIHPQLGVSPGLMVTFEFKEEDAVF